MFRTVVWIGVALSCVYLDGQTAKTVTACFRATQTLKSVICTMDMTLDDTSGPTVGVKRKESYRIVYVAPNKIAVRQAGFSVAGGTAQARETVAYPGYYHDIVSDGTRYYVLDQTSTRYVLHRLSQTGITGEAGTGAGAFQDYTFGDMLLNHDSNYVQDAHQSGKLIGQESIGGVLCDKVKLSPASGPVLLWIGTSDHLLRRAESHLPGGPVITEQYKIVQKNNPVSSKEFTIVPPRTAHKVEKM